MRGLFLRIYVALGVALLLGVALVVLVQRPADAGWHGQIDAVAEFPAEVTRRLAMSAPGEREAAIAAIRDDLGHEVSLLPRTAVAARLDAPAEARLERGETVVLTSGTSVNVVVPLSTEPFVAVLGPIDAQQADTPTLATAALLVLLLAAVPWMLRPLDKELRALQTAADRLGQGELDVRADAAPGATTEAVAHSFNDMARRLQAALRSQRDLLHAVSHELRSPLQRIRFALDLLPYAKTPEDLGRRVGELQGDVDELDALVDELLTWSRVENGETSLQRVDVDVASVLDGVADAARRLRPEVEVRLEVLPLTASLDDSGFRRAVTNLVNNAVRYTDTRVVVSATLAGDRLTVQVDDDGDGVPEADRERIFEPFVRLDAARSRDTGGVGLGLAIVSRLAGDHGGAVHVEPSPLGGARFVWTARV